MSRLKSLDREMERCHTREAQATTTFEALEKRVAVVEEVLVQLGWHEMRIELKGTNEKMTTLQGNWEATTFKLQELDSEVANA